MTIWTFWTFWTFCTGCSSRLAPVCWGGLDVCPQGAGAHPVILRANSPATPGTIQDTLPPALPVQRIPNPHVCNQHWTTLNSSMWCSLLLTFVCLLLSAHQFVGPLPPSRPCCRATPAAAPRGRAGPPCRPPGACSAGPPGGHQAPSFRQAPAPPQAEKGPRAQGHTPARGPRPATRGPMEAPRGPGPPACIQVTESTKYRVE